MADGKIVYEVDYDTSKAEKSASNLGQKMGAVGEKMTSIGSTMTSHVTAPILAGATAGIAAFSKISSELDTLKKSAIGVGASVEGLQALQYAGEKAGIEQDKMVDTLKKVQELATSNSDAFFELGIQLRDANGQLRGTDEVFNDLVTVMSQHGEAWSKEKLLAMGFTEELVSINKVLDENSGYAENYQQGLENAISEETISKFEEFNDKMTEMKNVLAPVGVELAERLLPYLSEFADWMLTEGVDKIPEVAEDIADFVEKWGLLIAGIAVAGPALTVLGNFANILSRLQVLLPAITTKMGALGLSATTVAGAGLTLALSWDEWLQVADDVNFTLSDMNGYFDDLESGEDVLFKLGLRFLELNENIINLPFDILNAFIDTLNDIANFIAKYSGVEIFNIPKIKRQDITSYFEGEYASAKGAESDASEMERFQNIVNNATSSTYVAPSSKSSSVDMSGATFNLNTTLDEHSAPGVVDEVFNQLSQELQMRGVFK